MPAVNCPFLPKIWLLLGKIIRIRRLHYHVNARECIWKLGKGVQIRTFYSFTPSQHQGAQLKNRSGVWSKIWQVLDSFLGMCLQNFNDVTFTMLHHRLQIQRLLLLWGVVLEKNDQPVSSFLKAPRLIVLVIASQSPFDSLASNFGLSKNSSTILVNDSHSNLDCPQGSIPQGDGSEDFCYPHHQCNNRSY
jgi:hypothetical protein